MVQWSRLTATNARGADSILGWGTKIPHAAWHNHTHTQKKTKYLYRHFSKEGIQMANKHVRR